MVESFKHSELAEVESMRALRAKNMEKHRQEDSGEIKYCLCRKGPSGFMFQCELCKDWFHGMLSQLHSMELLLVAKQQNQPIVVSCLPSACVHLNRELRTHGRNPIKPGISEISSDLRLEGTYCRPTVNRSTYVNLSYLFGTSP